MIDGQCETAVAPGSATRIKTTVLGNPVYGDMTGDGNRDAAVLLSHDPGGSGTFYYAAAALHGDDESVYGGWVIIGHEVRSFEPCGGQQALWLMGNGAALKEIMNAYNKALPLGKPYQKLFMLLGGKFSKPPADGCGAEYEAGFIATQLVSVVLDGSCTSDIFTFISR